MCLHFRQMCNSAVQGGIGVNGYFNSNFHFQHIQHNYIYMNFRQMCDAAVRYVLCVSGKTRVGVMRS